MPELTDDQPDEYARREHQIRNSTPAELTDADLEAMAYAHKEGCVRMAMAELLAARKALDEIARRVRPDEDGTWTDQDGLLESIGNIVESTGRKVWEEIDV
ncbi:hypothetical protein [Nocardia sp. NPDC046763]|uniref:hypothetical protein n=1 Tax=Nocardia sp. NPDC046763 TaxID=3155256 RepID=UPI0033E0FF0A